jgi:predicted lactoylglutathione lyase
MIKQIFVNLSVKNLDKTKEFWQKLGFTFNPQFTDQNAGALVLGENIFVMLLTEEFFKKFTQKEIVDATKATEVNNAISVGSKQEVDDLVNNAIAAGGMEFKEPQEGTADWMYGRAFQDLDGHQWEVLYMDITKMPK